MKCLPGARPDRHLQPLVLRGRAGGEGPPRAARAAAAAAAKKRGKKFWEKRYEDINAFERHLVRNGTVILKFFLNVSKDEQKRRFLERLDRPGEELEVLRRPTWPSAAYWDDYMAAYEDCLSRHEHRVGPVVRRPGRPQVGHPGRRRRHRHDDDPLARPEIPRGDGRAEGAAGRGEAQLLQRVIAALSPSLGLASSPPDPRSSPGGGRPE